MGNTQESQSDDPIINLIRSQIQTQQGLQKQRQQVLIYTANVFGKNLKSNSQERKKLININQLQLDKINQGKYLEAYVLTPPFQMMSIMFVIIDINCDCINFALYNSKSNQPIEQQFLIGQKLQILDPYFKMANDGKELIRVDNPNNLILIEPDLNEYFNIMTTLLCRIQQKDQQLPQELIKIMKQYKPLTDSTQGKEWFKTINTKLKNITQVVQEQEQEQEPYWQGHHAQVDKIMNTSPEQLIDPNQVKELQEMMQQMGIYSRFILANSYALSDPMRAFKMLEILLKETNKYGVIYFNYGEVAFQMGNYQIALSAMENYLKLHEKKKFEKSQIYNFAHYHIGFSSMMLGQHQEAEKYLKQACALDPQNLTFQQALSDYYFRRNQNEKAEEVSLQLVREYGKEKRDFDDQVELQRSLYLLFKISLQESNMEKVAKNADKLAQIDEENFIYIYNEITHYFLDNLNEEQQLELIGRLSQSQYFDVICEELYLLYLLNLSNTRKKREQLKQFKDQKEEYFKESQIQQQQSQQSQQKEAQIDESNTEEDQSLQIDREILELIKPEKEEINFDKTYVIEEMKSKKRKVHDHEKSKQIQQENQVKYQGYFAQFDMISSKYIITVDPKIKFDPSYLRQKFRQAAFKGFAHAKFGQSGIKQIKLSNRIVYELKILNNGNRLICQQREKLGKNFFKLHFEKMMDHNQVERYLKNI